MFAYQIQKMDSDTVQSPLDPFKQEEARKTIPSLRQQLGELKIKCAASLCILLVLLIEALARRIEQRFTETIVFLNTTKTA